MGNRGGWGPRGGGPGGRGGSPDTCPGTTRGVTVGPNVTVGPATLVAPARGGAGPDWFPATLAVDLGAAEALAPAAGPEVARPEEGGAPTPPLDALALPVAARVRGRGCVEAASRWALPPALAPAAAPPVATVGGLGPLGGGAGAPPPGAGACCPSPVAAPPSCCQPPLRRAVLAARAADSASRVLCTKEGDTGDSPPSATASLATRQISATTASKHGSRCTAAILATRLEPGAEGPRDIYTREWRGAFWGLASQSDRPAAEHRVVRASCACGLSPNTSCTQYVSPRPATWLARHPSTCS